MQTSSFTIQPVVSPTAATTEADSMQQQQQQQQHTAFFITSKGESAFLDPLCAVNSATYCSIVKTSNTELKYIFDTATNSSTSTVASSTNPSQDGTTDDDGSNSQASIATDAGCHVDLAVLAKAKIIRGPVRNLERRCDVDGATASQNSAPKTLLGFSYTEAEDLQVFPLGTVTITSVLLRGGRSPTEDPVSACCYVLRDEKKEVQVVFAGSTTFGKEVVVERAKELSIPDTAEVFVTYQAAQKVVGRGAGASCASEPYAVKEQSPLSPIVINTDAAATEQEQQKRLDDEEAQSPLALKRLSVGDILSQSKSSTAGGDDAFLLQVDDSIDYAAAGTDTDGKKDKEAGDAEGEEEEPPLTNKQKVFGALGGLFLAFLGLFEGFAFAICGICNPDAFRDQMEFKSYLLVKLFMSGVGFSMIAQAVLSLVAKDKFAETRFYSNLSVPYRRAIPGCLTLGVGMYVAGSGPTMAPAQLGSGVKMGPFMIAGMAIGGLIFSLVEKTGILNRSIPKAETGPKETSLDAKLGLPYAAVAFPAGVLLVIIAVIFEVFFPHLEDVNHHFRPSAVIPWSLNPIVAGLVIGFNQVPIRILSGDGQGGSTAIMNIIGTVTCGVLSPNQQVKRIEDTYQFCYVYVGTTLGAVAAAQSFTGYEPAEGFTILATLIGAAVMFFGARFAHGCTCGHGISGMSELSLGSIIAGMCIFIGGILAGVVKVYIVDQV